MFFQWILFECVRSSNGFYLIWIKLKIIISNQKDVCMIFYKIKFMFFDLKSQHQAKVDFQLLHKSLTKQLKYKKFNYISEPATGSLRNINISWENEKENNKIKNNNRHSNWKKDLFSLVEQVGVYSLIKCLTFIWCDNERPRFFFYFFFFS